MKKRILAISLVLIMIICNSMVALADTTWNGSTYTGDGNTHNVTAKFEKTASPTYDVTIMWGSLQYVYDGKVEWDGTSVYNAEEKQGGGYTESWSLDGTTNVDDTITVSNSSDKKVKATFSFTEDSTYLDADESTIVGSFNDGTGGIGVTDMTLGSAAIADSGDISNTMKLGLSGVPMGIKPIVDDVAVDFEYTGIKIGTVTVTLAGIN